MENGEFDEGILNQAKLRKSRGDGVSGQSTGQMMSKLTAVVANERDGLLYVIWAKTMRRSPRNTCNV